LVTGRIQGSFVSADRPHGEKACRCNALRMDFHAHIERDGKTATGRSFSLISEITGSAGAAAGRRRRRSRPAERWSPGRRSRRRDAYLSTGRRCGYRVERGCAIRRGMPNDHHKAKSAAPAARDKAAVHAVGEDEAGMRLDRWLRRRFPALPQAHLMKIVRKGEVRVSGRRADVSTRLEQGQTVRVPPLKAPGVPAPAVKRANPEDAEA